MTQWLAETMLASTALMIAALLLREPVARRFGARAAYLLWLAPALRMILPPLPESWFGVRDAAMASVMEATRLSALNPAPASGGSAFGWPATLIILWIGGALLFFGWHMISYARFVKSARAEADWIDEQNRVSIASSSAVASPVAFGIFGKTVMIPADFGVRYEPLEQRLALAHELTHHKRHDLPFNLAALIGLSLHWFNPIAHLAYRAFRVDQEAACDAQILRGASSEERHAYGSALYKSATASPPLAACAMDNASTLKARLSRIIAGAQLSERNPFALAPLMLGGLLATASLAISPEIPSRVSNWKPATPRFGATLAQAEAKTVARTETAAFATKPVPVEAAKPVRVAAPLPQAPLPPARPEPVLANAEPASPPASPDAEMTLASACQSAQSQQVFTQQMGERRVTIITCDDVVQLRTNARTPEALAQTRSEVARMEMLSSEQRAVVIKGIDQILSGMLPVT